MENNGIRYMIDGQSIAIEKKRLGSEDESRPWGQGLRSQGSNSTLVGGLNCGISGYDHSQSLNEYQTGKQKAGITTPSI
jgi:hypothetical protein